MMLRKSVYIVLIVISLAAVRLIGGHLFYDPLIDFFHIPDYQNYPLPEIEFWKFSGTMVLRYGVNTILTLMLVHVIFQKKDLIWLTGAILGMVWIILFPLFLWGAWHAEPEQYRYLFYVRRILIHPVLTLILIPALLYHEKGQKKEL